MFTTQGQIEGKNNTGTFEGALIPRWTDNALYLSGGAGGLHIRVNNTTDAIVIDSSENVTISSGNLNVANLTASEAVVTDGSKNLASLAYTSADTANTLVERDASGNFSAGTITAALSGNATTATTATNATNATNVATTAVSNNASYFLGMFASNANSNQGACLTTTLSYDPSSTSLIAPNIEASSTLQVGTGTVKGPLTVQGAGGTTYAGSTVAYFGSVVTATVSNIYMINIDKSGNDGVIMGVNKNSATGQVLSNGTFFSSYEPGGSVSIGRGDGTGLPSNADIQIDTSGNVIVKNGNLTVNTATAGFQQKSAALSGSTANATLVTGIVLSSGASGTINNSAVTTSHIGFTSVTSRSGTATTQYDVTCSAGTFSVSGGSLDNSTVAVLFVKAL